MDFQARCPLTKIIHPALEDKYWGALSQNKLAPECLFLCFDVTIKKEASPKINHVGLLLWKTTFSGDGFSIHKESAVDCNLIFQLAEQTILLPSLDLNTLCPRQKTEETWDRSIDFVNGMTMGSISEKFIDRKCWVSIARSAWIMAKCCCNADDSRCLNMLIS